jgi:Na+-transporting NADH:ubiquinone oxidoreductase subunit NqrB
MKKEIVRLAPIVGAMALVSTAALAQATAPATTGVTEAQVLAWMQSAWDNLPGFLAKVVSISAIFAAFLPPATPGTPWAYVRGVIDFLGANFGNAKNAPKA